MFCTNIESCVINNGSALDYFRQERVRQGDPLAPYLFLLAIETLAIVIHENKEIKGIKNRTGGNYITVKSFPYYQESESYSLFLWNGKDKVTRLSAINSYESVGVRN